MPLALDDFCVRGRGVVAFDPNNIDIATLQQWRDYFETMLESYGMFEDRVYIHIYLPHDNNPCVQYCMFLCI